MDTTLWLLVLPLVLGDVVMRIIALVSLARAPQVRGSKAAWAAVIVLVSLFGWLAYFLVGRREA